MNVLLTRDHCQEPVRLPWEGEGELRAVQTPDGRVFPAQRDGCGAVAIVTGREGETLELAPAAYDGPEVTLETGENRVDVRVGGSFFTAYQFDPAIAKPFLGPIVAGDGTEFTRLDLSAKEHPHQRSMICAVGDVNGVDFWNEYGNFGFEKHQKLTCLKSGPAFARIGGENIWVDQSGKPQVREERTYTFYNQSAECRYVDFETTFFADFGRVEFGPTKEAGPLGIRVAEFIRADHGGSMVNSYGARGEAECWSRSAQYCAYEGKKAGKVYGIAAFDAEDNERYPTAWHIRDYGLFAANNLFFKGGLTIEKGEKLMYKYRICFYEGDGKVQDRFNLYLRWLRDSK